MQPRALAFVSIAACLLAPGARGEVLAFRLESGVSGQDVRLASALNDWDSPPLPMEETSTGTYELELEAPFRPTLEYKFVVDGKHIPDPENPDRVPDGFGGFNSVVAVPGFREDPWLAAVPGVPTWVRRHFTLKDLTGASRRITALVPPYTPSEPCAAIYFQDGQDYLNFTGISFLLANLSTLPGMPCLAGVFVPPRDRMAEYSLGAEGLAYARFLAERVVPAVEDALPVGGSAEHRLLVGPSLGGLITVATALRFPEVFPQAASQSGSFWLQDEAIVPKLAAAGELPLRLFFLVGYYEAAIMPRSNEHAFEAARDAGLDVTYRALPTTHDWLAWRNELRPIFLHYFDR
jgi:enterochelin esterase-like enzyme